MFTGIVQAVGVVVDLEPTPTGQRLRIDPKGWEYSPSPGDSICVSGCCLTVVAPTNGRRTHELRFDVIPETLSRTTLGSLRAGSRVNLEHAVTPTTLMGGHFVQGHVDGIGTIEQVRTGDEHHITVRTSKELLPYLTPKGSVCIDGVSLTIAAVDPRGCTIEIALIPTTLAHTTLASLQPGSRVNIEADMMAKTIVHHLRHFAS